MSNFVWQLIINSSPSVVLQHILHANNYYCSKNCISFSPCMELGFLYDLCDLLNQNLALEKLITGGFQETGY
jgi:hypothetical protein